MSGALILIVEDDRLTALDLATTLRKIGYRVADPVATGAEAIEKAFELNPDLIIADISLEGDLDGIETVKKIQKLMDVPVVYFTAYSTPQMFQRARQTNLHGYLVKPVTPDDLYTTLETALQRSGLERKLRESEIRFRLAFENAMDAIVWADAETGILIDCNRSAEILFEKSREEIIGQHQTTLHPEHDREEIGRIFTRKAGGSTEPVEASVQSGSGRIRTVTINTSVTLMEGRKVIQGVFRDITDRKKTEDALRESEEKFRLQFNAIPVPTYIWRLSGDDLVLEQYNDAAIAITRGNINKYSGITATELYAGQPDVLADLRRCMAERSTFEREMFYPFQSTGENRYLIAKYAFLPPDHILVHTVDISARKKAEEEIVRAKEEWEKTFDAVPDLIAIIDRDNRIVRANKALEEKLGSLPEGLAGKKCYEYIHGTAEPPSFCPHALTVQDGSEHISETHESRLGGDYLLSVSPLRDAAGAIIGSVHVARDITDRKKAEKALQEANELLEERVRERTQKLQSEIEERKKAEILLREGEELARALINSSSEPVFLLTTDGRFIDVNQEIEKRFDLPKERIIGRSFFDFLSKPQGLRYQEKMETVVESGKAIRFENQMGDGWYDTILYPVPDHMGKVSRIAVFAHDITDTRRMQKDIMEISELERRRIGQDLHDGLGQKLTGVAFLAEAVKRTMKEKRYPEVSDIEEIYDNITESIDHARKISSGLWTARLEKYDAGQALSELAGDTENLFGITCILTNGVSAPVTNITAVTNLYFLARESINNAIRHGKADRIDIELTEDLDSIYLIIRDNGRGAAENFEDGSGIGMRIMRYRAGIMGGSCSFENTAHGFTVRVTISKEFIDLHLSGI